MLDSAVFGGNLEAVPKNPYEPPRSELIPPEWVPSAAELRPIPFEDLEIMLGFWPRVGAMFQLLFRSPWEFFERIPVTQGFMAPWRFGLLLAVPAFLIFGLIFAIIGVATFMAAIGQKDAMKPEAWIAAAILGGVLVLMPVMFLVGMIVGGAINHGLLWVWGGLKAGGGSEGIEQTIRATGYINAFILLGAFIPLLGYIVQLGGLVFLGMGLARMHRTDTWRGICAVLSPILLCCLCYGGFVLLAIAGGVTGLFK